jgi:hypothetical protein
MFEGREPSITSNLKSVSDKRYAKVLRNGTHFDRDNNKALLCDCRRTDPRKNLLTAVRIPERYLDCSFENFKTEGSTSIDSALLYAKSLAIDYPAVDRGLLFMAVWESGKPTWQCPFSRALLVEDLVVCFASSDRC